MSIELKEASIGQSKGWIGVDFDGTLAHYDGWKGLCELGEPIKPMVDRVKRWVSEGRNVRIFTARYNLDDSKLVREELVLALSAWCLQHIGRALPVTCVKDLHMIELWDDRAVQVIENTGEPVGYSRRGLDD